MSPSPAPSAPRPHALATARLAASKLLGRRRSAAGARPWAGLAASALAASLLVPAGLVSACDEAGDRPAPSRTAPDAVRTAAILSGLTMGWFRGEWAAYKARFVSLDGRVIDNGNGGVSHSEGQGYGMLLALTAGDRQGFDTIWRWTVDHLRKRPDPLFAWRWDLRQRKATDLNNASDGDVLIAWALARAAKRFKRPDYEAEARAIARALAEKVVVPHEEDVLLMPGVSGFGAGDQPNGPVVNLSYWVFAAFHDLEPLAPQADWGALRRTGYALLDSSRFGPLRLPTDWIALGAASPAPAANFAPQFGYDAIRIPLYLAQDPEAPPEALARFTAEAFVSGAAGPAADAAATGGSAASGAPAVIDVASGTARQRMDGAGYRMVFALARCIASGDAIPASLMSTRDAYYYPETLRLLSLSVVQERSPKCL